MPRCWPGASKDSSAPSLDGRFETRGKAHFASFPEVQVDAVGALVRSLCERFSIARNLPALSTRFEFDPTLFATFKGVCTHANFRRDKWDIGPAFGWDRPGL
jgi:N-acetyl-anhydromuramyl-L-alanine amidase AmpD